MNDDIPILFDTDIGSDIDDAVALAYLLTEPRCELLGITTVTGEPVARAQLADAVCRAFGRNDVPVHAGAADPILIAQQQPEAPQKSVLERWAHRDARHFAPNVAVDFLRQTIRSRPGEITLLSVGPMTNVGLLFALDPEIPRLLRRHVLMGGAYLGRVPGYGLTEWNAKGDPHATGVVFRAATPEVWCVGLDVTTQCMLDPGECRRRFGRGPLKIVGDMAEVWFRTAPKITFHDPLAAVGVFDPSIMTFEAGRVDVELKSDGLTGMTVFHPGADPGRQRVATAVRPDAFFERYFSVTAGEG